MTAYPALTADQVDDELRRLVAERDAVAAALAALETHDGWRLLADAPLVGESARRRAEAVAAVARIWRLFSAYEAVLGRVKELRERWWGGAGRFAELTELLRGPAVVLDATAVPLRERSLTGPAATERRLTLAATVEEMTRGYATATELASAADAVWSTVLPRLDKLDRMLAAVGESRSIAAELVDLRRAAISDPLSLCTGTGLVDESRLDRAERTLTEVVALRSGYADRVASIGRSLDDLGGAYAVAAGDAGLIARKVGVPKVVGPVDPVPPLRARLAALPGGGDWPLLAVRLRELEADIAAAGAALRVGREETAALLARRDELRGRLDAYRAKAVRLGRGEEPVLDGLYRAARALLWTAPCDLPAATAAVTRYRRALAEGEGN